MDEFQMHYTEEARQKRLYTIMILFIRHSRKGKIVTENGSEFDRGWV